MAMFGRNRNSAAKVAPTRYPVIPFHLFRTFQFISSIIVGIIMCYFIYHLSHDNYGVPWTFIWLVSASFSSVAALTVTVVLHCCVGLRPRLNIYVNGFLAVLWALSWSLLTWYMSGTLSNLCDIDHWVEDTGIMVCRIYKALFAFTLVGLVSTLAALILDIYVSRQDNRRGIYRLHDLDDKPRPQATSGPYTQEGGAQTYAAGGLALPRESEAWEEPTPRPSMGPYSEEPQKPAMQKAGYNMPEEQFRYDGDTGYHGRQDM